MAFLSREDILKTLTFFCEKGGVGKTTCAFHVAAGLADHGRRVLLIDADGQAHATRLSGFAPTPGLYNLLVRNADWRDSVAKVEPEHYYTGREHGARGVAWILHSSSEAASLPWHRVIGGAGRISLPRRRGFEEQKRRLSAEGVAVSPGGRVDLKLYQWEPSSGTAGRSRAARKFLTGLLREKP